MIHNFSLNTLSLASRQPGTRLFVGGSHGGYIGTQLSGQYPDEYVVESDKFWLLLTAPPHFRFDAIVLRNPVTDLGSMLFATDIPDWYSLWFRVKIHPEPIWTGRSPRAACPTTLRNRPLSFFQRLTSACTPSHP